MADEATTVRPPSPKQPGLLSRVWHVITGGGGDDYEKRLEYLSKQETAVLARMTKRAAGSRHALRNFIAFSALFEVAAIIFTIMMSRSVDLDWQLRAVKSMPMFLFPALAFGIYSALVGFTKMRDRKDQKTLERLRAERKAKIDELKERTNFYSTQQLIQRYDLDPAAKAAAATVLASKLSADSGLKVFVEDAPSLDESSGRSNDVELVSSEGLRNRKKSSVRGPSSGDTSDYENSTVTTQEMGSDYQYAPAQNQQSVEHYNGPPVFKDGWFARLAAMLVGEDPAQCYALICKKCLRHNGLARKEDLPYVTYYCPYCGELNDRRQMEGSKPGPDSGSVNPIPLDSVGAGATPQDNHDHPSLTQVQATTSPPTGEVEVGLSSGQS